MSYKKMKDQMEKNTKKYAKFAYDCTKFTIVASCYALASVPVAYAYMYGLQKPKEKPTEESDA